MRGISVFLNIIYYCLVNRNISQCKYVDTNFVKVTCKLIKIIKNSKMH